jgi:hypothetical protein
MFTKVMANFIAGRKESDGAGKASEAVHRIVTLLVLFSDFAARWVRSVRAECLDQLLIVNETHLRRVLREYTDYYDTARPHQGLAQQAPISFPRGSPHGGIHCRDVLGGIIHDYCREAA